MAGNAERLESGDMYSSAFQFYSHISAGVDPRTGMFGASVEFTTGLGNVLRGPTFGFRLAYSALSTVDEGFGEGWHLGLTELRMDGGDSMLTLSSGDSHKVIVQPTGMDALFPDRKLDSCRLVITDPDGQKAMVEHITGVVEHLAIPKGVGNTLRCHRIVAPNGDSVTLHWERNGAGRIAPTKVTDDDGTVLLGLDYLNDAETTVVLYSHDIRPLRIRFEHPSGWLRRITIPIINLLNANRTLAEDEASWTFDYVRSQEKGLVLLESMETPDGIRDEVTWQEQALRLPEPMGYMPAVATHKKALIATPGHVIHHSTFSYDLHGNSNYYGYPEVTRWEDRADQLLHLIGDGAFLYGSTETQFDGHDVLMSVERTYNQYHLIMRETTRRGKIVQDIVTEYDNRDVPFERQPKSFQLPRRITTSLYSQDAPDIRRVTSISNAYDDDGNLLSSLDSSTGVTEVSTYYPVEGEKDEDGAVVCPADPLGLVRRLKSRSTLSPCPDDPLISTTYTYGSITLAADKRQLFSGRERYVQGKGEITAVNGRDLIVSLKEFVDDPGREDHGTVASETTTQDGLTDTLRHHQTVDKAARSVTIRTTHTTHDGFETTVSETKHLISGLPLNTTDAMGSRTDYGYDALARLTELKLASGDEEYETTTRWAYQLSRSERSITRTGITGLDHTTSFDERGQVVLQKEPTGPTGPPEIVRTVDYDLRGRQRSETVFDFLGDRTLALSTSYDYDDWDEPARVTAPDGSVTVSTRELVSSSEVIRDVSTVHDLAGGDVAEVFMRIRQWRETADGTREGGLQTSYVDAAGRQRLMTVAVWEGNTPRVEAAGKWVYDGLGRCIQQTDAMGQVTTQEWDHFGRLVTTVLPGGDAVRRVYAPGQEGDLMSAISMTTGDGITLPLGTRTYDGLGRLTGETAGSLTHRFTYDGNQMSASSSHLPGGGVVRRTYDRMLGEVLLDETLDGSPLRLKHATYDKKLGLPLTISSEAGTMTIRTDFLGRMTEQDIAIEGDSVRHAGSVVTAGGMERERNGVDGRKQSFDYDDLGRCVGMSDLDVTVSMSYDAFSRLSSRVTRDASRDRSIEQRISYDALGRVKTTTFAHTESSKVSERELQLYYRPDNKITRKQLRSVTEGTVLRDETMDYDVRGRLVDHAIVAESGHYPTDERGHAFRHQVFSYGAIDNLLHVTTTRVDGVVSLTTYDYDEEDPDRVARLTTTVEGDPGATRTIVLAYDGNGHLTSDGQGHELTWDTAGRLTTVTLPDKTVLTYRYGPDGRIAIVSRPESTTVRYHIDGALANEITGNESRRYIRAGGAVVAETLLSNALRKTWLLGSDPQGSILTESSTDEPSN